MTNAVHAFCRHCGGGMTPDARFCGACGVATNNLAVPAPIGAAYVNYADVPWFRQQWFAVVCFLIFSPALVYLLLTGDIYVQREGHVRPIGKVAKGVLIGIGTLAIIRVLAILFS